MTRNLCFIFSLIVVFALSINKLCANNVCQASGDTISKPNKKLYFTIKYGQGGFSDSRSPKGKLGGGQLGLMAQHIDYPLAISIFSEYYTNSSEPENPYEISDMGVINLYYSKHFLKGNRMNIYAGPGLGYLAVPQIDARPAKAMLYNVEIGVQARLLWKFGLYATYKYLYAYRQHKIDFSEHILLVGINFRFKL